MREAAYLLVVPVVLEGGTVLEDPLPEVPLAPGELSMPGLGLEPVLLEPEVPLEPELPPAP